MTINRPTIVSTALLVCAAHLAAQEPASCSGAGAAFKVSAYQCASCTVKQGRGVRTIYQFYAEPVVLEAEKGSALQPGDVIEAVNGKPITTRAGSDQFTYPQAGKSIITVRRANARVQLTATADTCEAGPVSGKSPRSATEPLIVVDGVIGADLDRVNPGDIESVEVLKGALVAALYGDRAANGVVRITTKRPVPASGEPLIIVDGVPVGNASEKEVDLAGGGRRFGFGIGCLPSCTRARAADGTEYYKFDGFPPIVGITAGGPAASNGIRVGDLITDVDGKPILEEAGALRMLRASREDTIRLTVLRDGKRIEYVLRAR